MEIKIINRKQHNLTINTKKINMNKADNLSNLSNHLNNNHLHNNHHNNLKNSDLWIVLSQVCYLMYREQS